MYIKVRSVVHKLDLLQATIAAYEPDIIGITESWTTDKILDSELSMPGYDLFRCDRPSKNMGGGVLLYIREELQATDFKTVTAFPEQVWCQLNVGTTSSMRQSHFMLMGDFNYPGINWTDNSGPTATATEDEKLFWESLDDNFVTQHVKVPTRMDATLDLVLTREPDLISAVQAIGNFGETDHEIMRWDFVMQTEREQKIFSSARDYNREISIKLEASCRI